MDADRFDALARAAGSGGVTRRRSLLRGAAAGAVAAVAGRASGARPVVAQGGGTCSLSLTANVRSGPSAAQTLAGANPGEIAGTVEVTVGPDGAIDQGVLRLPDGTTLPVVGQATGRAVDLRVRVGLGQVIVMVGVADQPMAACAGAADGLLTGPQPGDLGDWHATLTAGTGGKGAGAGGTIVATGTATTGGGAAATVAAPTAVVSAPTAPAATEPSAPPTATPPSGMPTAEPTPAPTTPPEPTIEPTTVPCPTGTALCGAVCVDLGTDPTNCGTCGNVCPPGQPGFVADCAAGNCFYRREQAPPCDPGLTRCASGCVDLASDPVNCGSCGTMCGVDANGLQLVCAAGQCACPPGLTGCGGCVDLRGDAANCGACGNACAEGEVCFGGVCAREHR